MLHTGCFFYLETGLTLPPDFILRSILTIKPFTSPWDYVQSNVGSIIILRSFCAELQANALNPYFQVKWFFVNWAKISVFFKFAYRPNYKLRDVSIKAKLNRNFENIEEEHLPKFGIRRVPYNILFQQNLKKYGIIIQK